MEKKDFSEKPSSPPSSLQEDGFDQSSETEKNSQFSLEDSPIEEVRGAVPPTDDTSLPTATFRAWFWGIIFSAAISFSNQVCVQINSQKLYNVTDFLTIVNFFNSSSGSVKTLSPSKSWSYNCLPTLLVVYQLQLYQIGRSTCSAKLTL